MKTIKLTDTVMVSDPCYTVPTWCQHKLTGVLPGEYVAYAMKSDEGDWGTRVGLLFAVHKDYAEDSLNWRTVKTADIGVDSGQCGIFSMETYRNDSVFTEPNNFGFTAYQEGDHWYGHMCDRTLTDEQWGVYDGGVVSSSGYGDGSYRLLVAKAHSKIVGIGVDFLGYKNLAFNIAMEIAAE
jgi:hypothetical protein